MLTMRVKHALLGQGAAAAAWHHSGRIGRWFPILGILLATTILFRGAVHVHMRGKQQLVTKAQLDALQQALQSSIDQTRSEVLKQINFSAASWVKGTDVQLVARVNAACRHYNASDPKRLQLNATAPQLVAPVVVLAHSRVQYLAKTMVTLITHWSNSPSNAAKFPLFISVDGNHQPSLLLATSLHFTAGVQVIKVERDPSACPSPWHAYCNLAMHYKVLLQLFFECLQAPRLIFLEEDLQVAPDFFSYFEATAALLDTDTSLYCISAWNDQGQAGRASNSTALYRTDVFPGLGWMLTRPVGLELMPTWSPGYWDDNHLRKPEIRKGRQCVFPEVPRTHTFGAVGASEGMFYGEHLANMVMNKEPIDWSKQDLSYLQQHNYAALMRSWLGRAQTLNPILSAKNMTLKEYCNATQAQHSFLQPQQHASTETGSSSSSNRAEREGFDEVSDVYITYQGNADFERLGRELPPMLYSVSGGAQIPRGVYNGTGHGVVVVRCRDRRLFLLSKAPGSEGLPGSSSGGSNSAAGRMWWGHKRRQRNGRLLQLAAFQRSGHAAPGS